MFYVLAHAVKRGYWTLRVADNAAVCRIEAEVTGTEEFMPPTDEITIPVRYANTDHPRLGMGPICINGVRHAQVAELGPDMLEALNGVVTDALRNSLHDALERMGQVLGAPVPPPSLLDLSLTKEACAELNYIGPPSVAELVLRYPDSPDPLAEELRVQAQAKASGIDRL
jgi:hypothetical protein